METLWHLSELVLREMNSLQLTLPCWVYLSRLPKICMDFLCDKKIVDNHLHDSSAATSLVQNLFDSIICEGQSYSICKDLNRFYERPWRTQLHTWKSTLKRDYFSSKSINASSLKIKTSLQRKNLELAMDLGLGLVHLF